MSDSLSAEKMETRERAREKERERERESERESFHLYSNIFASHR